jgi:hypothetical protein
LHRLSSDEEEEVILRSMLVIDHLRETAIKILVHFAQNIPCPEAKRALLNRPEEMAVRAVERAIQGLAGRGQDTGPLH